MCITIDSATQTETITNTQNTTMPISNESIQYLNGTYYVSMQDNGQAVTNGKIYTVKEKRNTVTITARPSCGCRYSYRWRTNTFVDYCPHCHNRNCLRNVHKWQAKHEQELTCTKCGADYCGQCGKEKYSWSRYYITKI